MKKLLCFSLILILTLSVFTPAMASLDKIAATGYYLIAPDTGSVLAENNCSGDLNPGDFSKIMTAIVALESLKEDEVVPFSADSLEFKNSFGNIMNVKTGYELTVYEHLLNMLLLYSDASANQLAVKCAGSTDKFVNAMNKKAAELEMTSTIFTSPSGFGGSSGKTNVYDLVKLAKYAMDMPVFKEICSTDVFYVTLNGKEHKFSSRNHLISKYTYSDYTYRAASGIMPSYFKDNANFIAFAEKDSSKLLGIIINSPNDSNLTVYKDIINLLNYGYDNFYYPIICREGEIIDQIQVKSGNSSTVTLQCDSSIRAPLPYKYDQELLEISIRKNAETLKAPIKKGAILGYADYTYNKKHIVTVPLVADKDIRFSFIAFIHDTIFGSINPVLLFVIILVVFICFINYSKGKAKKAKRAQKRKEILERMEKEGRNK